MKLRKHALFLLLLLLITLSARVCFAIQYNAILPVPNPPDSDPNKVKLGRKLYNDTIFSKNNSISCASCHVIRKGGADNLPKYKTLDKTQGDINTPTVLNASLNYRQFWDGRAKTFNDVIDDHLQSKTVFDQNWDQLIQKIEDTNNYHAKFKQLYPDGVTVKNVQDALTNYLNSLLTPQSAFDRYLKGDKKAISEDAKKGFDLFRSYGCVTCHQGPNMGGNLMQRLGIYKDYYTGQNISEVDLGHFNISGKETDKYVFKVPSLRNIALTGPYLHDGSINTLEEVIEIMAIYENGQPIPAYEIPYIVKFLQYLTGKLPDSDSQ